MSQSVTPLHFAGQTSREWLQGRATLALEDWAREWLPRFADDPHGSLRVDIVALSDVAPNRLCEFAAMRSATGQMWFRCSRLDRLTLGSVVVGADFIERSTFVDDWIAGVVDGAEHARISVLCRALLGEPGPQPYPAPLSAVPQALFSQGSGAVRITCDEIGLQAIADGGVWSTVPPAPRKQVKDLPDCIPLHRAMHRAKAQLEVILGGTEIEGAQLIDLRAGDVLRLQRRLDESLELMCEGERLGHAALGRKGERVAVRTGEPAPGERKIS